MNKQTNARNDNPATQHQHQHQHPVKYRLRTTTTTTTNQVSSVARINAWLYANCLSIKLRLQLTIISVWHQRALSRARIRHADYLRYLWHKLNEVDHGMSIDKANHTLWRFIYRAYRFLNIALFIGWIIW